MRPQIDYHRWLHRYQALLLQSATTALTPTSALCCWKMVPSGASGEGMGVPGAQAQHSGSVCGLP